MTTRVLNAKQANIISIHTPTRGVTLPPRQIPGANIHFNPHSHKGSDCIQDFPLRLSDQFQSTLPQGEWQKTCYERKTDIYFNPHSHKGSDKYRFLHRVTSNLFQSTLPQGEWRTTADILFLCCVFQSTLPQGEWRRSYFGVSPPQRISIHTPTRGVTVLEKIADKVFEFQSTLPQGEWQQFSPIITFQFCHYLLKEHFKITCNYWHK